MGSTIDMDCSRSNECFTDWLKCNGDTIFYAAVAVVSALLLVIIVLIIVLCCVCCRKRRSPSDADSREEESNLGKKGDAFQMDEIGGESNTKGEKTKSKTQKANNRAEDTKLENFAEAMYATVDCGTQDQPSAIHQTKQTNMHSMMDGDNYDIITHVEEDHHHAPGGDKSSSKSAGTKSVGKTANEKKTDPGTVVPEVEYSVPDKARKKKKQNEASTENLERGTSGGEMSTTLEYNNLLHVTSGSYQQLSMPLPTSSEYSVIARQDGKQNGSTSDVRRNSSYQNGRQRGRTRSPPEEPPPPLPPPFVDVEENPAINDAVAKEPQSSTSVAAASEQQTINGATNSSCRNDLQVGGNTIVSSAAAQEELALYDDPDNLVTSEPQQEMYMNVAKR